MDIVPDTDAQAAYEAVEDGMVSAGLKAALDDCFATLPEDAREIIRRWYYGVQTLQRIAEQTGSNISRVRLLEQKGLRALRHKPNRDRLYAVMEEAAIESISFRASGLQRFRDTWTSSVELAYERLEAMRAERAQEQSQP